MSKLPGSVAMTMAGLGSRFTKAGYDRPKYEIVVLGRPLFDWSMLALSAFQRTGWSFLFATRREQEAQQFVTERCKVLGISMGPLVELDDLTNGQATTALRLAERCEPDAPFAVFNIDTFVTPNVMRPDQVEEGVDGWVPCFPGLGDGWSFARADETGRVVELREKVRISPHATVGLYWFSSARLYRKTYEEYFRDDTGQEVGECYIAPMYNQLIKQGMKVAISSLMYEDVGMLGTPEQVASFSRDPPSTALLLAEK